MRAKLILAAIFAFGLFELGLAAFAATSTDVSEPYRAYYIDRSTGCLPRIVSGAYELGTEIRPVARKPRKPFDDILVCGFENSMPEGTWLRGSEGRLSFAIADTTSDLQLSLQVRAPVSKNLTEFQLMIAANGQQLGTVSFTDIKPHDIALAVPQEALAPDGRLNVELRMSTVPPLDFVKGNSRTHSLVLQSLRLDVL